MADKKVKATRKCLSWLKTANNAKETLSSHSGEELQEVVEICTQLIDAANQVRKTFADSEIEKLKKQIEDLQKLKGE